MANNNYSNERVGSMRLGVSPLSWVNEVIEEFGKDTSRETCLTEAASAGYAGVEMSRLFPREAPELLGLLSGYGLELISGWHSGFLAERGVAEELEAVHEHARLLSECGAEVMVYGECGAMAENALDVAMSQRLRLSPDEMNAYGGRLSLFAETLKNEYGLSLAYHHHLMMVAETLDEVRALMNATTPAVGLLLDTGHAISASFDYVQLLDEFGSRINHIHLKDVRADILSQVRRNDLSFNEAVRAGIFTVPGDGMIDFSALTAFLQKSNYSGWLVVEAEQDPLKAPPAPTVARACKFVSEKIMTPLRNSREGDI